MFVGGKGGVGKTTCAAAYAVAAARAGRRVLLVSTDPAHSLGDALEVRLSSRPCTVRGTAGQLQAVELDAPRAFARWLGEHRRALGEILEHGTWLDRDDVDALLGLSIPGIDELIGIIEIVRLSTSVLARGAPPPRAKDISTSRGDPTPARAAGATLERRLTRAGDRVAVQYDLVIVDTAPTGHTLHLFAAPEVVGAVASVLMDLQHEHRMIREQLTRVGRPETADRLIDVLGKQARDTAALLRDARRTALEWVMLPERLSLAETADALAILDARHMNVSTIVVNRVLPDGQACPICDSRRTEEARVIAGVRRTIARRRTIRTVAAQRVEPRGLRALETIGRSLFASNSSAKRRTLRRAGTAISVSDAGAPAHLSIADFREVRLVFVGGKGGVGKTTIAAALATTLASRDRERRVLLLSTDPAHSLGDVFSAPGGDKAVPVPGGPANLLVREIDAAAALGARRKEFESALEEIVGGVGAGDLVAADGVSKLVELAPPGIDELFGFISVTDSLKNDSETLLVIDTAPTGHALRLLELPDAARSWVQALLRILLKYRNLSRPGQLAADLVDLSHSIRSLQDLIRDSRLARFLVVTRAAELPRLETVRLLKRLKRLRLNVPAAIVNARTLAPGGCSMCRATASAEERQVAQLKRECRGVVRDCAIIQTPLAAPPPRGAKALERWARTWTR